jgi:hypothetical protein
MELENFKYNLSRLKKCDQYWDEMQPVAGGRHCASCRKKIVDFSQMSFTDIALFMSERKEPVCGFYLPEQLRQISNAKSKLPVALGLSTLIATASFAQPAKLNDHGIAQVPGTKDTSSASLKTRKPAQQPDNETVFISGKVLYYDTTEKANLPVAFATVRVKGSSEATVTTEKGEYRLFGTKKNAGQPVTLVVSSIGFKIKETALIISGKDTVNAETVMLEYYDEEMTQFYVTARKRSWLSKFWRRITRVFR